MKTYFQKPQKFIKWTFFLLSQNRYFYSYILMACYVKFVACSKIFLSKLNRLMTENFGTGSPIFKR